MDAYEWQEAAERWTVTGVARRSGAGEPPVIARAQGPVIHDTLGRRYLDFGAIPSGAVLGHNHPRYVTAIRQGLQVIGSDAFLDGDALRLHRRLGEILAPPLQKSILAPRGVATRLAAGIAQTVTGAAGLMWVRPAPDGVLRFFHPAAAVPAQAPIPPLVPMVSPAAGEAARACPDPAQCVCGKSPGERPCPWVAFETALQACERKPAGLLMAPFAGGAFGPGHGCARLLRRLCHQHGMLLVVDECATGYGRTGRMWGHQHDDIVPDILIASARFGAGLSIDAVCVPPDIAEQAATSSPEVLRGALDAGWHDPVACAAAVTAIDIVQDEDLVARAAAIGEHLKLRLDAMALDKRLIGAVYGRGTLFTIELTPGDKTGVSARALARTFARACHDEGLLLPAPAIDAADGAIHLAPPMVTTITQIDEGLDIVDQVLREMNDSVVADTGSGQDALQPGQHQLAQ
ncbi:aminotransferase class III-fold pyridoxal phosphate-dependent enzyme [Bordetella genomosp. 8]|nr:aminotransferase class III-fold pyridoxal phosphate-dependent enzyme [Bordetella genomosp. 8]